MKPKTTHPARRRKLQLPLPLTVGSALALLCCMASPAHATLLLTTGAEADTFITNGNATNVGPDNNYGALGAMVVAGADTGRNGEYWALLRFDLGTIKAGFDTHFGAGNWSITQISLRLASNLGDAGDIPNNNRFPDPIAGGAFSISWFSDDSWDESGVTWNNFTAGTTALLNNYNYVPPGDNIPTTWTLPLQSNLLVDITSGGLASLMLQPENTTVNYLFNSHTYTSNPQNQPLISITAIPEPTGLALMMLSGLFLLAGRRKSRNCQ